MCGVASGGNRVTADRLRQLCNVERMQHTLGDFGDRTGTQLDGLEGLRGWLKRRFAAKAWARPRAVARLLG